MTIKITDFHRVWIFKGYQSGEYDDGLSFAVPAEDYEKIAGKWDEWDLNSHYKGLLNLFPDKLLPPDIHQAYQFKITVEAIPIDDAAMPPIPPAVVEVVKTAYIFRLDDDGEIEQQ